MCEHAERDHESRKVVVLLERVKKQIEARNAGVKVDSPKPPVTAVANKVEPFPARLVPFER